jgi:Kef-type K+ transport system membrane component KefB
MILTKRRHSHTQSIWTWILLFFFIAPYAYASGGSGGQIATNFLWLAVLLLLAKASSLIEKWGQPAVLGELVMGMILGNLVLLNIDVFESVKHDQVIAFLAELGVVILLFQIGLESKIEEMRDVGWRAFWVATVGVIAPFVLGTFLVGPWLLPGLPFNAYLFLGAALTATSVGITGRVFRDLGKLQTREAQIVLGAAVIDDVMGLIILAIVTAIVKTGAVSVFDIGLITLKALLFWLALCS